MVKKNILIIILITAFFLVTASFASARYICPDDDISRCPDPEPDCLEYGDSYCSVINCCGGNHLTCSSGTCVCASGYVWNALPSPGQCVSVTKACAILNEHPSATSEKRCCNYHEPSAAENPWILVNSGGTCIKASCALYTEHPSGTSTGTCCAVGARGNVFDLVNSGGVCIKDTSCYHFGDGPCPTCCAGEHLTCSGGAIAICICVSGYLWDGGAGECVGGTPICALENEKFSLTTENRCCAVGERDNTKTLEKVGEYCRATCAVKKNYYPDADSDGYGRTSGLVQACTAPSGYTLVSGDCDDTSRYAHPGATEVCGGSVDEDCDGATDCADSSCSSTSACVACTDDKDCPDAPGDCYTPKCNIGHCAVTNVQCGADDYCCYPYCGITNDSDCDGGCGSVPVGQSATMTFRTVPTGGVGTLRAYGTRTTVLGIADRRTSRNFQAEAVNKFGGTLQCNNPEVLRGFAIMDTECIKADSNITSATFKFSINGRSGTRPTSIWMDQSDLNDSSDDWIISSSTTQMLDAVMVYSYRNLFEMGTHNITINPNLIKPGKNNRFVMRFGNNTRSDFNISHDFHTCGWSDLTCGDGGRCDCRPNGGSRPTRCGAADPCYFAGNLAFECYNSPPLGDCGDGVTSHINDSWGTLDPSTNDYTCWHGEWLTGTATGENPVLEITFCNPFYFGECDYSNGCTGAAPRATAPYNGCDVLSWADTTCGTETNCTDGIDNDCDGLIDASDPDCMQDESILAGNCDDAIDNEGDDGCDYDNSTVCAGDPNPATPPHGDDGCPVRIDGVNVNNTHPCQNDALMAYCTASVSGVNSVIATLNNAWCEPTNIWSGNVESFRCSVVGGGVQEVRCSVNPAQSFQDLAAGDKVMNVTVGGGCPFCSIGYEICDNGVDDDCDTAVDAGDFDACPEGSSNATTSPFRWCNDGISNDNWHDAPEVLIDLDDDGCCDLCNGAGYVFDASKSALSAIPGVGCGNVLMNSSCTNNCSWESGTSPYCCGDDINITTGIPFEFLKVNPANLSIVACCNSSFHCADIQGRCQVGSEEAFELCIDGVDNDCDGLIDGYDTNCSGNVRGFVSDEKGKGLIGAVVKSSPPGRGSVFENSTVTGDYYHQPGYFLLRALVGNYTFIARKEGYDDNATLVPVLPDSAGGTVANFVLRNGSCHADCTDYYGNCNPACEGLSFVNSDGQPEVCSFVDPLCYNRPKNFRATKKSFNDALDENITTEYTCCKGPVRSYKTLKMTVTGEMEDLYDYVLNINFMGKQARLHILTWNSKG